jgi:hypothetical protein
MVNLFNQKPIVLLSLTCSICYDFKLSLLQLVTVEQLVHKKWELTDEGKIVAENGSHEAVVYNAVPPHGILQSDLIVR